jgi:polysaccharide biosynthesis protein PslJ
LTSVQFHPVDLEPARLAGGTLTSSGTYATRRGARIDVASILCLMLGLLYLLPAHLIVPNLTYAGRPALMLALLLWFWWLLVRLSPWLVMVGPQPLRWVSLLFLVSVLLSYMAGSIRGLTSIESNAQDFTVLITIQFLGVIVMAADGIPNWARLNRVLQVLVWVATFMAVVGLMQSLFKFDLTRDLVLPGFQLKGDDIGFADRGDTGQFRVSSTATHYIEFSTCMAMVLPFAIHFARFSDKLIHRRFFMGAVGLIAAAIPIAISRTGIAAVAIIVVCMLPAWNWRMRYSVLVMGVGLVGALALVRPGLIGTVRAMFADAGTDPSISSRTSDYTYVAHWFGQRPLLGRGPGTLVPDLYIYLDNEWLYQLVTQGLLGLLALAALIVTGIWLAAIALRRSKLPKDRHLCAAIIAGLIASIVVSGTFDSLGFTTFSFTLALMIGISGTLWRFTHPARTVRTSNVNRWQQNL